MNIRKRYKMLFSSYYYLAHIVFYNWLLKFVKENWIFYKWIINYGQWILNQELKTFHVVSSINNTLIEEE